MASGRTRLVLASVSAEVCYLYPLYLFLTIGLGAPAVVSPCWIMVTAAAAVMSNLALSSGHRRLLTILLVNLALSFFTTGWLVHRTFFPAHPFLTLSWACIFSAQNGFVTLKSYWLTAVIALWVWCRATLLTRRPPTFTASFTRFDTCLGIMFVIFLIASLAGVPVSGGMGWLLASMLSNAVAMSSAQSGSRPEGHPAWMGPAFLALLLVPATLAVTFLFNELSMIGNMAYGASFPVVRWLVYVLLSPLVWLLKRGHMVTESETSPKRPSRPHP